LHFQQQTVRTLSKKSKITAATEDVVRKQAEESKGWYSDNRKCSEDFPPYSAKDGCCTIPVTWGEHPHITIAERERERLKTIKIANCMLQLGIQRCDIVLLVYLEDITAAMAHWKCTFKELFDTLRKGECWIVLYCIAGDHTMGAIQLLHVKFPNEKKYMMYQCNIVIAPKNEYTNLMAGVFGSVSNTVSELSTASTMWAIVKTINKVLRDIDNSNSTDEVKKKLKKTRLLQLQQNNSHKYTKNSFGSMQVLGGKMGALWDVIYEICEGLKSEKSDTKGATSAESSGLGHFNTMAGIPEEDLVRWLRRVVDEPLEHSTKTFQRRCQLYKKTDKVQSQVLDFINQINQDAQCDDFNELVVAQPWLWRSQGAEFQTIVSWCPDNMKSSLPSVVKTHLKQSMAAYIKNLEEAARTDSVVCTPKHPHLTLFFKKFM
jgi:hypothetical protein